jgi:hypothetical protein
MPLYAISVSTMIHVFAVLSNLPSHPRSLPRHNRARLGCNNTCYVHQTDLPTFLSAITIDTSSAYVYMTTSHQQARVKWSLLTASTDMCTNFGGSQDNLQSHLKFNIQVARDTKSTTPHISGISSQTRQRQLAKFLAQRHDVITLLTNHSKTWACHDILSCDGLILILGFTC